MMKTNKIFLAGLSVMFAVAVSCTSDTPKEIEAQDQKHTQDATPSEVGNPEFKDENIKAVYDQYINLKTALVKSDAKEAQSEAAALQTALTSAGDSKGADMASKIASSSDIKMQRGELDNLTSAVEMLIKSSGLKSGKIFKQFCPMAQNGDGAYWLASETAINNPYYGDEMLECGEVKEEIN